MLPVKVATLLVDKMDPGPSGFYSAAGRVVTANPTQLILYRQRGTTGAQAAIYLTRSLANAPR